MHTRRGEQLEHYLTNLAALPADCKVWPYSTAQGGYGRVTISGKVYRVHVLACVARWGRPSSPDLIVAHGPCNNHACWNGNHVSWKTQGENMADRVRDMTLPVGERHGHSKLTDRIVTEIRQRWSQRDVSQSALAREYGVDRANIGYIVRGDTWRRLL